MDKNCSLGDGMALAQLFSYLPVCDGMHVKCTGLLQQLVFL